MLIQSRLYHPFVSSGYVSYSCDLCHSLGISIHYQVSTHCGCDQSFPILKFRIHNIHALVSECRKRLPTEQSTELTFHHELSSSIPHPFSRVIRVSHHIKASIFNFRFRGEVGVLFHCSDTVLNYLSILKIITKEIIPFLSIEWNSIKLGGPLKW